MRSVELKAKDGVRVLDLHETVTVLKVSGAPRDELADQLAEALGRAAVVRATELPVRDVASEHPVSGDLVGAEAAVATAEAAVRGARDALERTERDYVVAQDILLEANRAIDRSAGDAVAAAEARLEVAQAGAAAARRALLQAREEHDRRLSEDNARAVSERQQIARLREERETLEAERAELVMQLGELPEPADPAPIEAALAGLHRLQQVKPRPSDRGAALADRWLAVTARLAQLPSPPAPPDWLVTPAMAALQEAREGVASAEVLATGPTDPAKVEAVERAHREALEAEQRVMRKGSRSNRRRLDQAHDAEHQALVTFGVATYGEFLQRVAPGEGGMSVEERLASARAALADAEAVWEELHGGEASPDYTEAKSDQADIRAEAIALLGEECADDELADRLRAHLETVVDTEWATDQLTESLAQRGVDTSGDLEQAAREWLASLPDMRAARDRVETRLGEIDGQLRDVEAALADHGAAAFFGDDVQVAPADGAVADEGPSSELTAALSEAEAAEGDAADALVDARRRLEESESASVSALEREKATDVARIAVDEAKQRLTAAEVALAASRAAAADASKAAQDAERSAGQAAARRAADAAANGTRTIATEAWLLARFAAARATSVDAPIVVDARAVETRDGLRLIERLSARGQVVVLGDEGDVAGWAASLGDRAAVRTI